MPAYLGPDAGGTLDWSWAEERLIDSHCYWVATTWPDGRPHLSAVWGVWLDGCLWFSCDPTSRKARNLAANGFCSVATENPLEQVVVSGRAVRVEEREGVVRYVDAERQKYLAEWDHDLYTVDFFLGGTFRTSPVDVIGIDEATFATSPTRWTFAH